MKHYLYILFLLLPVLSVGQDVSCEQYYQNGYYPEAIKCLEGQLKECEKQDRCNTVYLLLGESNYAIHNYNEAANYFSKIPINQFSDKTAQIQYLQTLRAAKKYDLVDELITTFKLDVKYKEQWVKAVLKLKRNGFYTISNVACAFGESFLGGVAAGNGIITAVNKKDAANKTVGYRLAFFRQENDTTLIAKKVSYLSAKLSSESVFEGNPANFGQDKIIFCKNTSDSKWFAAKKVSKLNLSKKGESLLRLYVLDKNEQTVEELPESINKENKNTVTPFYDAIHQVLFFSQNNQHGKYNIYYTKQNGGSWSDPIGLTGVNTSFDEVYPVIVGNEIYFASRGRGGLGGLDVFMGEISFDNDNISVKNIKNLGTPINSGGDDFALFFIDKNTGYFASNRKGEHGNDELFHFVYNPSDIVEGVVVDDNGDPVAATMFIYRKEAGVWQIKDTIELSENGVFKYKVDIDKKYRFDVEADYLKSKTLYFPSEDANELREDSKEFFKEIVLEGIDFKGKVKDAITEKGIAGIVVRIYENGMLLDSVVTDENGEWKYRFDRNKDYKIEIEAHNYDKEIFELPNQTRDRRKYMDLLKEVVLSPKAKKDAIVKIDNIYFDYNSAAIKKGSYPILDNIVAFLKSKQNIRVELGAHTDCEGGNAYNMKLSQKRAQSCYNYIIGKGISKSRLIPKGYGETKILNGCVRPGQCSEKENEVNRRIEVKFLED